MNLTTPIPTAFESTRLHIRRYELDDEDALFNAARASIAEVFEFLPWCHPDYALKDAVSWLESIEPEWKEGKSYAFAILDKTTGEFHGGCGLNQIDEHPVANLGYWIKTTSTGKGFATEATIALARFGIEQLGLQRIEIVMSVENSGSKAVAEGAGAIYEGRARNRLLLHGRKHDAFVYAITS